MGKRKEETYCRDETGSTKQAGGPHFVTESWDPGQFGLGPIGTRDAGHGMRDPGPGTQDLAAMQAQPRGPVPGPGTRIQGPGHGDPGWEPFLSFLLLYGRICGNNV